MPRQPISTMKCHPGSWRDVLMDRFMSWDDGGRTDAPIAWKWGFTTIEFLPSPSTL